MPDRAANKIEGSGLPRFGGADLSVTTSPGLSSPAIPTPTEPGPYGSYSKGYPALLRRDEPSAHREANKLDPARAWFCRVCGLESPECIPAMGRTNRANPLDRAHRVIALPCEHEQPADASGAGGLGFGIPPSVQRAIDRAIRRMTYLPPGSAA